LSAAQIGTYLGASLSNLVVAMVCIVSLVFLLTAKTLPGSAVRVGAAGFICLLLDTVVGIAMQTTIIGMRDAFASDRDFGLLLAATGLVKVALNVLGLLLVARAIFAGRSYVQKA
jgi:hypothetical protein